MSELVESKLVAPVFVKDLKEGDLIYMFIPDRDIGLNMPVAEITEILRDKKDFYVKLKTKIKYGVYEYGPYNEYDQAYRPVFKDICSYMVEK